MEELIGSHAAVAECAVVGIDDGERTGTGGLCRLERWYHC